MGSVNGLVVAHVAHHHVEQVVEVPGHQVAAENLRPVSNRGFKGVKGGFVLGSEGDLDEHVGAEADGGRVYEGHVPVNEPSLLEAADPPEAGRR